jgi:peptidoglycan-associated lipoprotein
MNRLPLLLIAVALVGVPACGKSKKQVTTPAPTAAVEPEEKLDLAVADEPAAVPADEMLALALAKVIYFEFDSAMLSDESRDRLAGNAKWLAENPRSVVTIEGHTDEDGTTEYNIALGDRRAQAAREYLIRMGVDPARVRILSFGEEQPVDPMDNAKNRRDEFVPN